MRQFTQLIGSSGLAISALSLAFGLVAAAVPFCYAAESSSAGADASDLKGHVVTADKQGGGEKDSTELKEMTFGAISGDGLGKAVGLPASPAQVDAVKEVQKKEDVQKTDDLQKVEEEQKTKEAQKTEAAQKKDEVPTKTASIDLPLGKKVPVQKGKAESDGTVSHGETGVDWSKWVGVLADRWYLNLKNLEFRSAKIFRTARPALIHFTCYRNGTMSNVYLRQTCGVPAYDQMQIEALKRCTPLPPFPEGSVRQSYSLLQGWECHPREAGESDFKPGSYGKNFPVEHVSVKPKSKSSPKMAPKVPQKQITTNKVTSRAATKATPKAKTT